MNRVLFVDDDVLSLQLMTKASSLLGFQAIISPSAHRGLLIAAEEKPALILVDMQMDEMDGVEFVRQIRQLPGISDLPILIYTASIERQEEERARLAGANGCLLKPLGLDELSKVVQRYTSRLQ